MRRVLRKAIRWGGTTISTFENAVGTTGRYQRHLAVYGRAGKPCVQCGATILRMVQQQRSTFFCPSCQRG